MNVVATTPSGRKVYLAAPATHAVETPTLYVYHEGKHVDAGDLLDKILNLSMKPVSFVNAEDAESTDLPVEHQMPAPAPLPKVPRNLFRVRSGQLCYCLLCGSLNYAYGQPTLSVVTAPWCPNCERNDYLIPPEKVSETAEQYKDSLEFRWVRNPEVQRIVQCTGMHCLGMRQCEHNGECPEPDKAFPTLGLVKRPVLRSECVA